VISGAINVNIDNNILKSIVLKLILQTVIKNITRIIKLKNHDHCEFGNEI